MFNWHRHQWEEWKDILIDVVHSDKSRDYQVTGQKRYCLTCNQKQIREV